MACENDRVAELRLKLKPIWLTLFATANSGRRMAESLKPLCEQALHGDAKSVEAIVDIWDDVLVAVSHHLKEFGETARNSLAVNTDDELREAMLLALHDAIQERDVELD
jgi:hypothetical protein